MSRCGNVGRCIAAAAVLTVCVPVAGQDADRAPPDMPSLADALAAFNAVEPWIRAWAVPHASPIADPAGAAGACVVLRLSGRTIGRGTAMGDSPDKVWRAAREAFVQAQEAVPVEGDALRARRIEEIAPLVTIDLQLAGRLTPMLAEDESAVSLQLSPGLEGVAARVGERVGAVFPGTMLSTGITPGEGLRAALSKAGAAPLPIKDLVRAQGVRLYRFRVHHLAQAGPGEPPVFLYRGGRVVSEAEVSGPALRQAAGSIVSHMLAHAWPGQEPHGLTGDYKPLTDRFDPLIAPPIAQAACALALAKYAATPGIRGRDAARAAKLAAEVLDRLTVVTADEENPLASPLASAMWLAAYEEVREIESAPAPPAEYAAKTLAVVQGTLAESPTGWRWTDAAPVAGRGLLAYAMTMAARRDESLRPGASAAVRTVFRETDPARLVAEMPWLGWAELALLTPEETIPSAVALAEIRRQCWQFQVREDDVDDLSRDLVGGIVFTRARNPLPTWNTLRPVAFLATMLGDPRITPDAEVRDELSRLRLSLRFLLQLIIDKPLTHMFRDAERATGGVRPAVWEQTASLEASAMALLCLSETLRASDSRASTPPPARE